MLGELTQSKRFIHVRRKRKPAPGDPESGERRVRLEPPSRCEEFTPAGLRVIGMSVSRGLGHRCLSPGGLGTTGVILLLFAGQREENSSIPVTRPATFPNWAASHCLYFYVGFSKWCCTMTPPKPALLPPGEPKFHWKGSLGRRPGLYGHHSTFESLKSAGKKKKAYFPYWTEIH